MKNSIESLAIIATIVLCGCVGSLCLSGNHQVVQQKRHLQEEFTRLDLESSFDVEIADNNSDTIVVEAESNLLKHIVTEVNAGTLTIKSMRNRCIDNNEPIKVYCRISDLQNVTLSGSGAIDCKGLAGNQLAVNVEGSGDMNLSNIVCESLSCNVKGSGDIVVNSVSTQHAQARIDGSGNIKMAGTTTSATLLIEGSGNIHDYHLTAQNCLAKIKGSGNIEVTVIGELDANIDGSGSIHYKGYPRITRQVSGSGDVESEQ